MSVGLSFDQRSNLIFVAGGSTGAGYAYDAATGELVAQFQFSSPTTTSTFVNDVVVTSTAAFFTDSFRPFLYQIPLGPGGTLPDSSAFEEIELVGDWQQGPGFNANGIAATPNGNSLFIVNSLDRMLYLVDPATGEASLIDLGGEELPNGDGLLLDGQTLYVVQNRLNQIAVVQLDPMLTSGSVVDFITDSDFRIPTTIAEFGRSLYAVNARFGEPTTEYEVVKVLKVK
jgi:sugar lactone lactonase YvrE